MDRPVLNTVALTIRTLGTRLSPRDLHEIRLVLDQKPLGRRMEADWNRLVEAEFQSSLAGIPVRVMQVLEQSLTTDFALSPQAGLQLRPVRRRWHHAQAPDALVERVRQQISDAMTRLATR